MRNHKDSDNPSDPQDGFKPDPWSQAAIEQNRRWLSAFLLAATGDRFATDDLVQEVFRVAYEKRGDFTPGTNFGGWLREIARNCLKRHFAEQKRLPTLSDEPMRHLEHVAASAQDRLLDDEAARIRRDALTRCLGKLAFWKRRILEDRLVHGMPARDVAKKVRMTVNSLNVTIFRIRRMVADCVRRELGEERHA